MLATESYLPLQAQAPHVGALGYDFAVLGLRAHEARVGIIRNAACQAARRVSEVAANSTEEHELLSQVVSSTYRLLDPRQRAQGFERVQLSVLTEEDWELQRRSRFSNWVPAEPLVQAELV